MSDYYREQLDRLGVDLSSSVQIRVGDRQTKWLDLNEESLPAVIDFLKMHAYRVSVLRRGAGDGP